MEQSLADKKEYELSYLLKSEDALTAVKEVVANMSGEVIFESALGRLELSFPIKKETHAFFGHMRVKFEPKEVTSLEQSLALKENILRYLIVTPLTSKQMEKKPFFEKSSHRPAFTPREASQGEKRLSNEDLEKKIEEILK